MNTLLTPQAKQIYLVLQAAKSATAAEIADRLSLLPNTVYRAAGQLVRLGVARKTTDYPVRFELIPGETALAWYTLQARREFMAAFPAPNHTAANQKPGPSMTLIRDRRSLLAHTNHDAAAASQSINFVVSGLEVPDATILAYRGARARGVNIRALLQKRGETRREKLERWQDIGVDVRAIADMGLRLFIFDAARVYCTSYSQQQKEQAFGVRFDYAPLAGIMNELFEERWSGSKPL